MFGVYTTHPLPTSAGFIKTIIIHNQHGDFFADTSGSRRLFGALLGCLWFPLALAQSKEEHPL
jgi:hypothetical protein